MDHLQLRCCRFHALDVVDLTSDLINYYGGAAGIPEYINMIEVSQKKAQRAQLPIPDVTLTGIAMKLIFQSQSLNPNMMKY